MQQVKIGVASFVFLVALAPGLKAQMMAGSTADQPRVFEIRANKNAFSPFVVIVKQGDRVRLVVTAVDRDYRFKLGAFHVDEKLKQGVPTTINFIADQTGRFTFSSSGLANKMFHHHEMKGTLVVKKSGGATGAGR